MAEITFDLTYLFTRTWNPLTIIKFYWLRFRGHKVRWIEYAVISVGGDMDFGAKFHGHTIDVTTPQNGDTMGDVARLINGSTEWRAHIHDDQESP
jgi:hypothetical protein